MYKIFLDQPKTFECDVKIEGASMDDSKIRLFLESENFTISFNGKINKDGAVKIPIQKMKGILQEDVIGKMYLEVIAEDTVFKPWEGEYQTSISKKVQVEVNETLMESKEIKPKISITVKEEPWDSSQHVRAIFEILKNNKVEPAKLVENKSILDKLVNTYCSKNSIFETSNIVQIKKDVLNKIKKY